MKDLKQSGVRESTVVLVCRDIELSDLERREIQRSEAAIGRTFHRIHRIEWTVTARPRTVEVHALIHAGAFDCDAKAAAKDARSALQAVTKKLLAQKRLRKETALTSRRSGATSRRV